MDSNLNNVIIKALDNYYKILENTGYVNYSTVNSLLVLTFINDILNEVSPIDEKDYNNICKVWDCLASRECLIDRDEYKTYSGKKITGDSNIKIRISDNQIRVTNKSIRVTHL